MNARVVAQALCWMAIAAAPACDGRPATAEDCRTIFERIVEIELHERGFRDPALRERKREQLARFFAADVRRCHGRSLRRGALACVRTATSNEALSHECLR